MANSFGPSGAGGDPVSKSIGDAVDSILPKEVVSKVKQSSKAVSDAVSSFAKGLAAGAQKMKEASVERQYNLLQEIRDEKQFRRDFAAWMKQEAKDELQYKKDIASLMKEEANKELQYRKDISKLIEDQLKYEMDFYELVTRENQKIADEENKAAEDRIRRLREDIQARAAIEDAANRERAGVIASIVSLENQKHREMEQSKKDYLDSVISLEKQKYETILQDQKDYIASVVSLEKQKFDKKGLERATKELKGFDKVVATGSFRLRAFAKVGGIAAAAGMALFAKNSIQAALAQEQLDKSLKLTLNSIGKGALSAQVSQFIEGLQSLTNVTEEQLVPALQQLIAQTGDLDASQALLTLALDVSAGTGKDLSTTLDAITKAAVGNYKSIGTLGIGYTAAQAKTMGFAKTMQVLQKYTGAAEEATLTFGGQIKSFKISAGEATETLGTGFLNAYAIISGGQPLIKGLGDDLEVAAKQFSNIFVGIAAATKEKGLGIYADLAKVAVEGLVGESGTLQKLEKTGMKFLNTEKETSNQREDRVKTTKKILTFDQIIADIQKKILATEKLTTKEKTAQQALEKRSLNCQPCLI